MFHNINVYKLVEYQGNKKPKNRQEILVDPEILFRPIADD